MCKKALMAVLLLTTALYATACGKETETVADVPEGSSTVEFPSDETEPQDLAEEDSGAVEEAATKAAEEAAEETAKAAEEEANTYYEEGRARLYGMNGYEIDLEAAYTNFEKALELGKTEANFYLGVLYDWYGYPEKDYEKAKAYYEAAGDNPYAKISLGNLYYYGQGYGLEEDRAKAKELFEAVIAEGYVEGYFGRGEIARADKDYDTALECFNKVLEGEEQIYIAWAMNYIAHMYEYGEGVEQDYAKALEWLEKTADLGISDAITYIGLMYINALGVEQDYAVALEWLEKAAGLANTDAMNNVGYMYHFGQGVEQDYIKAIEWYEKSADLGNVAAMSNLGTVYLTTQDYAKALGWFEKAADSGNATAMQFVAYMYENGLGVAQNSEKAQEWYDKAELSIKENG